MFTVGFCRGMFFRYTFNVETGECEGKTYGGCGYELGNMFDTEDECNDACVNQE